MNPGACHDAPAPNDLHDRLALLEMIIDNSLDAILLTRPDGTILRANPAACRLFDRTEDELRVLGRGGLVDASRPNHQAALDERRRTGRYRGLVTLLRRDGSRVYGDISSAVFRNSAGVEMTSMVIRDVTEQRRAELALATSERMFRTLTSVAPVGIFMTDAGGLYTFVNPRWCEIAGLTPAEVTGTRWTECVHPDDREQVVGEWTAAGRGDRLFVRECRFLRPDGTATWVLAHTVALHEASGEHIGDIGTITDITDRRRAAETQIEAEKLRAVTQLANTAAHEINNPLAVILGQLDLFPAHVDDETRRRLATMRRAGERIRDIVARMFKVTTVEKRPGPPDLPEMLDLRGSSSAPGSGGSAGS